MIGILDYGLGNINSFTNIIRDLNVDSKLVKNLSDFDDCSHFILPSIKFNPFSTPSALLLPKICIPTQIPKSGFFFSKTWNFIVFSKFLLLIFCIALSNAPTPGKIKKVKTNNDQKLPHMGWNRIIKIKENKILNKISEKNEFYFLHSYYFESSNEEDIVATTFYSNNFPVIVNRGKIYGIQFHPEKSHELGRKIIENFTQIF